MTITPGTRLGPYEIVAPIGVGGMGEVYRARDTRLNRAVAVKILPAEFARDAQSKARFEREAKAISQLNHPHICTLFDVGENYLVMEYLEGETLADRIARGPLPLTEVLKFGVQIAEALDRAHRAGIVHRDLKPGNVMLTKSGAKLLDFGLATTNPSVASDDGMTLNKLTKEGTILGTLPYMAPEQLDGLETDARSDIFALGAVLYEMLTGKRAFEGTTRSSLIAAIISTEPKPVSAIKPLTPPAFEHVIAKCLAKTPDDRWQSAHDIAEELRWIGEVGLQAGVAAPLLRERKSGRRLLGGSVLGLRAVNDMTGVRIPKVIWTAFLVVLVAAATTVSLLRLRTTHQRIGSLAVIPFVNASHDAQTEFLAEGMTDTIINKLAELPELKVMSRTTMFRYKGKDADPQEVGRELKVGSVLTGRILQIGDRLDIDTELVNVDDGTQLWGERYARRVADVFALQDDIAQQISQKLRLKLTGAEQKRLTKRYTDDPEAYSLYAQGRFYWNKRTATSIKKAIDLFSAAIERDPNYALAYLGIADCYTGLPQYAGMPVIEAEAKASQAAVKALEIDPDLAEARATLGYVQALLWQWQGAEAEFRRAIALKPNYATAHHWYALTLGYQRRYPEALAEIQKALALDPQSSVINGNVGVYLNFNDRKAEAVQQLRRTVDLDPAFPYAHMYLGRFDMDIGDFLNGILELQKAVELSNRSGEPLSRLGFAYAQVGRRDDALAILDELKRKLKRKETSPFRVGYVYAGLGDRPNAYRWFDQALREHDSFLFGINAWPHDFDAWRADPHFQQLLRGMNLAK
jgi:TolB-like protein/Flp pilus assembly protein TadD/predicted Ser/Thr protein kinase